MVETRLLEEEIVLDKKFKHEIDVVDRLVLKPDLRQRLTQSVETAAALADGLVAVDVIDGEGMLFSEKFACPEHGVSLPELQPRSSPSTAARRPPAPHRARLAARDRPRSDRPRHERLGRRRRPSPGRSATAASTTRSCRRSATVTRSTPTHPGATSRPSSRISSSTAPRATSSTSSTATGQPAPLLHDGVRGDRRLLERRYKETDSAQQRERIEEYMSLALPYVQQARA